MTPREDSDTIVNAWRAVSNIDALLDEDLTPKAREAEDEEEEERQVMEEQKGQVQQLKTHFNAALQASLKIKDSYRTEGIRHSMSGRWESMTTPSGLPPLEESSGGPLPWESGYQSASGIGALGGPSSISLNRGMYGLRSTAATPHGPSPLSAVSSSANSASSSDGGAAPPTLRLPGASTNSRPNSGGAGPGGAAAPAAAAAAAAPFRPPPMALGSFVGSSAAGGGLAPPPLPGAGGKKPMGLQLAVGSQITHGEWTSQGQFNQKEKAETYIPPHLQQIRSDDLKKEKELGRGCFGSVYYALWKGVDVALKEFHHNAATDGPKVDIFAECESLASLRHPCIIAFYGIVVSPEALGTVLEYMRHGSLRSGLQKLAKQVKVRAASTALHCDEHR